MEKKKLPVLPSYSTYSNTLLNQHALFLPVAGDKYYPKAGLVNLYGLRYILQISVLGLLRVRARTSEKTCGVLLYRNLDVQVGKEVDL